MNRRELIKTGLWTMTAGAALMAAGCGSSNSQTLSGSGAGANKPKLKIGYLPITDHLTVIGLDQHQFTHSQVEAVKFSNWAEIAEAIKAGAIQGAFLLTPIGLTLRQKGVPLKAVMLGHRNGSVLTVKKGDGAQKIEDLRGKTVAIPSRFSTHHILIRKALADRGVAASEVKLLDMAPPEMVNALATGRIDAFIVAEPFGGQAELQGHGQVLTLSKDLWPDHICCALNIQESVLQQHPEAVTELVGNLQKAGAFIDANPEEASKLSVKYLGQKKEVITHVLTQPRGRVTFNQLAPALSDFTATQDYMLQFGITTEKVDLAQYVDNQFASAT